jgi:hypothetical protein
MALGLALMGCAVQRALVANEAPNKMIGLSKEQVLACMGPPDKQAAAGETEVWTYNSGNGQTNAVANRNLFGVTAVSTQRFCTVNVVMTQGSVSNLNYNGPSGGVITQGEQCAFAVQNCVH